VLYFSVAFEAQLNWSQRKNMPAEQYPFAQELITDVSGQIRKVILDFNDYKRMLEMIEDEGLYRAMMEVKNETSLDWEAALAELDKE
jgi:hypothetical protein